MSKNLHTSKAIEKYYDRVAFDYRWFWNLKENMAIRIGYWDKSTKKLKDALKREDEFLSHIGEIKSTDHVLDAGCGVGGSAIFLAKKYGCRVTGITISVKQSEIARANAVKAGVGHLAHFMAADFNRTGFKDNTFDVIWAVESLSHSKSRETTLKELHRVLKPGGRLVGTDYFKSKPVFSLEIEKIRKVILDGLNFYCFEFNRKFKESLIQAGFGNIEYFDITKHALPSARKFYELSLIGITFGKLLEVFGLRKPEQTRLAWATHYQYKALRDRIHEYRVFYSRKAVNTDIS